MSVSVSRLQLVLSRWLGIVSHKIKLSGDMEAYCKSITDNRVDTHVALSQLAYGVCTHISSITWFNYWVFYCILFI